jgi:integrase
VEAVMAVAGSWQDALLGGVVMAPREVRRARSVLALLARFAAGQGIAAAPGWLLDYDVIEWFCTAGLAGRAPSTRGTYRSVLYQLAGQVHGAPGCRGTPFAGAKAPPPYSPAERAALAGAARAQPDPAARASVLAMLAGGIGAGLRPGELVALRGTVIGSRPGDHAVVHVTGGPAPRTVPVTGRYGPVLLALAGHAGNGFVFRPGTADRGYKNFVSDLAAGLARDPGAPRLSMSRCRSSFICDHLAAGTAISEILAITGITGAESLARYARHVPGVSASKAALRARWHVEAAR